MSEVKTPRSGRFFTCARCNASDYSDDPLASFRAGTICQFCKDREREERGMPTRSLDNPNVTREALLHIRSIQLAYELTGLHSQPMPGLFDGPLKSAIREAEKFLAGIGEPLLSRSIDERHHQS